ncbi:hypothetical protein CEE45_01500 [Candidatus Heimdallarchaeota archaeon B3_Heim]|nr:MAG: hypothetical protein CEE45_01500 [Candidatus Heimdallarchaeota archaeon B3_Heim]
MTEAITQAELEKVSEGERGAYWTRPFMLLENDLIIQEEKKKVKLRTEGKLWRRNLTPALLAEVNQAYEKGLNTIIPLSGLPGLGKTESARALAVFCRDAAEEAFGRSRIWWNFGFQETVNNAVDYQEGDIVEQDEEQRAQGMDSKSLIIAISDLQEIAFRKNKITYIVSSVHAKLVRGVAHVILEAWGGNYESRICLLKVYSAITGLPLGFVKIPLLPADHPAVIEHQKKETTFKTGILSRHGYTSVKIDQKRFQRDIQTLTKQIFGKHPVEYSDLSAFEKRRIHRYQVERLKTDLVRAEIAGSEQYQKRVLTEVWAQILDFKDSYKDILELAKVEDKLQKEEEKQMQHEEELQIIQAQRENLIPELVEACANKYLHQKTKNVQIRIFFEERGIHKDNLNYCLAKTWDRIIELENSFTASIGQTGRQALQNENLAFTLKKKIEDPDFINSMIQCFPHTTTRIKTKKLQEKHFEAWVWYYRDHTSVDMLKDQWGMKSKSTFTNTYDQGGWFAVVKEEILGHLVEDTLVETYYDGFQVIGGNTQPDLVKADIQVEVKARTRREPPKTDMFNQNELQHVKNGGNLELCLVSFQPGQCVLEIYAITEIPKEDLPVDDKKTNVSDKT